MTTTTTTTATTTTTRPPSRPAPVIVLQVVLVIVFQPALTNPQSPEFQQQATLIQNAVSTPAVRISVNFKGQVWNLAHSRWSTEFRQYAANTKDTESIKSNNIHTLQVCGALQTTICCVFYGSVMVNYTIFKNHI